MNWITTPPAAAAVPAPAPLTVQSVLAFGPVSVFVPAPPANKTPPPTCGTLASIARFRLKPAPSMRTPVVMVVSALEASTCVGSAASTIRKSGPASRSVRAVGPKAVAAYTRSAGVTRSSSVSSSRRRSRPWALRNGRGLAAVNSFRTQEWLAIISVLRVNMFVRSWGRRGP